MSVGLLILTHENIGAALLNSAIATIGHSPLLVNTLDIPLDCDPEEILIQAQQMLNQLNSGNGVLVLTDLYGATPSNVAHKLIENNPVHVVCGINLSMLVKIFNYPNLELHQLCEKAVSGGQQGIICNNNE